MFTLIEIILAIIGITVVITYLTELLSNNNTNIETTTFRLISSFVIVRIKTNWRIAYNIRNVISIRLLFSKIKSLILWTIFVIIFTLLGVERLFLRSRYNFLDTQMTELYFVYRLNQMYHRNAIDREKRLINLLKKQKKRIEEVEKGYTV